MANSRLALRRNTAVEEAMELQAIIAEEARDAKQEALAVAQIGKLADWLRGREQRRTARQAIVELAGRRICQALEIDRAA